MLQPIYGKYRQLPSIYLQLVIHYNFENIAMPSQQSIILSQAIIKFVVGEGYPLERYEIVTNFPRRILTDLDETQTLKELQLFPQETVFVQQRS